MFGVRRSQKEKTRTEFCVWLVPSRNGKVCKVRFGLKALLVTLLGATLIGGAFLFIASDYARLQMLRINIFLNLKRVTEERDKLLVSKESLEGQVQDLSTLNGKVLVYEQGVKKRVEELEAILHSATSLGLDTKPLSGAVSEAAQSKGGIGGAEIQCNRGEGDCAFFNLEESTNIISDTDFTPSQNLLETLDRYINLLRTSPFGFPADGRINSGFGLRNSPFHPGVSMHEGVDFSLSEGAHVTCTGDGVVKEVRRHSTYGLVIDVAHSDRVVSRYAHLSKSLVSEGEQVCHGEVIGLAGSTGRSTGPHLHYEILIDNRPRNPTTFLKLATRLNQLFG